MKKIRVNVRVTELDAASDAIVRLYKADATVAKDEYLKKVMEEIEELSKNITGAIKSDKTLSKLDLSDAKRDEIIRSLGTLLNGYAAIPIAEKKAAAEKLLSLFNKYKGITAKSYADESSLIESLLGDFSSEAFSDAINALEGVSLLVKNLRIAQDEFNKSNDEFIAANVNKGKSATAIKKALLAAINDKFVPYITAMNMAKNSVYADFAAKTFVEIEKVNSAVAKRGKAASMEKESE